MKPAKNLITMGLLPNIQRAIWFCHNRKRKLRRKNLNPVPTFRRHWPEIKILPKFFRQMAIVKLLVVVTRWHYQVMTRKTMLNSWGRKMINYVRNQCATFAWIPTKHLWFLRCVGMSVVKNAGCVPWAPKNYVHSVKWLFSPNTWERFICSLI